jgi:iron complex transport system substrate-binding protein
MKLASLLGVPLLVAFSIACGGGSNDGDGPTPTSQAQPAATIAPAAEASPVLPVTLTDTTGKSVTVKDVSRVIPLNGDVAEVVWALGLGEKVVATDTSATFPAEAAAKPKIGYQRTLSAEGIIAQNPSVLIGNADAGPPEVIEQLRAIGVPLVIVPDVTKLEDVGAKIRMIGKALGVPNRAEALALKTETEISEAKTLAARTTGKPRVMFIYARGSSVQVIMGRGSGGDIMTQTAGAIDVGVEMGIEGTRPLTPEALAAANPDVFLLLSAGLESVGGVDGLLQIPGVAQTNAGKNRKVIALDDQYLLGHGPRTGAALKDLIKAFHPGVN